MQEVLIAYDGSSCAEAALEDLGRAGLPAELEAMVLSVAEVWLPPDSPPIATEPGALLRGDCEGENAGGGGHAIV